VRLSGIRILRRLVLPLFQRLNPGNLTITHHYTGDRIRLHSFRHRGYWYHGKRREAATMRALSVLTPKGSVVFDIGGHIGYVSLYLASLVGPEGHVYVFEPGPDNLRYIRRNLRSKSNVTLIEKGAGSRHGLLPFYVENLSGQNSSFIEGFNGLRQNMENANLARVRVRAVPAEVVTLDWFCAERGAKPSLIKIDVEGYELEVLEGALEILRESQPVLVVEIQHRHERVVELLSGLGYVPLRPGATKSERSTTPNTLWLHEQRHAQGLASMRQMTDP